MNMINNIKRLLNLFYKTYFIKGPIIKDGVKYVAEPSNDFGGINIYAIRVEDVSCARFVQQSVIENYIYDFSKMLGDTDMYRHLRKYIKLYSGFDKSEVHLNKKDTKTLLDLYKINSENALKYTSEKEIVDVTYTLELVDVSTDGDAIIVKDKIKVNSIYFDGFESSNTKFDFLTLYNKDDNFYDYFRDRGEFGQIIDFFYSTPLIDRDSDIFVSFDHVFIF